MEHTALLLFSLIRYELTGAPLPDGNREPLTEDVLEQLFTLADKHDLAHLVGEALGRSNGLPKDSPAAEKFQRAQMVALYRYTRLEQERKRIYQVLNEAEIPFVPLKGILIRPFYPQPYLRTSCDIDILIHREDVERATERLTDALNYQTDHQAHYHDVSLFSPGGIHLELHFSIRENMKRLDRLLAQVWSHVVPLADGQFEYRQTPEFFMFHQIAHMAYHFFGGGCGIRPLMDLYLLRQKLSFDETALRDMCEACEIGTFYERIKELSDVWFEGRAHHETTLRMQAYILFGGVYGSMDNSVAVKQQIHGGKGSYLLHRIFMPYHTLKIKYPILNRHKWLYPVMTVRRWFSLLSPERRRRASLELKKNASLSEEKRQSTTSLLAELGLL